MAEQKSDPATTFQAFSFDFFRILFQETDPDALRAGFLRSLLEIQKVERGSIWIRTEEGFLCVEAAGLGSERVRGVTLGLEQPSIVGWVIGQGRMTVAEPGRDERHYKKMEDGLDLKSTAILCFPLILRDGSVYGAVELIDTSLSGDRLNLDSAYLQELQKMIDIGAMALSNTLDLQDRTRENKRLKRIIDNLRQEENIIGRAAVFLSALKTAEDYARTDFPVLLRGPSGTGKEIMARRIHQASPRREKPFLVQNCSSIPDELLESELFGYRKGAFSGAAQDRQGLFEAAHGGTLFLDEIGDLALQLQAKILRVLQEGEVKPLGANETRQVDVRLISATNRDLEKMIGWDLFREDLYYRLNVLPLELPSLARRPEDIPLLAQYFIRRESARLGLPPKSLSPRAMEHLLAYSWPGNIRELENLAKYLLAVVKGDQIKVRDLPGHLTGERAAAPANQAVTQSTPAESRGAVREGPDPFAGLTWPELEKAYTGFVLARNRWNVTRAARQAGLNRSTFVSRMRRLGISRSGD